jgi:membrane protein implicated in regulation of membrane protease activity
MTWANFYLTCFLLGFSLSLVSFLLGSLNLHGLHLFFHGHVTPHAGHGAAGHAGGGHGHATGASVSPFNFATITAFLAWFGGAGYLVTRYGGWWAIPALALAVVTGLSGAALMFAFMVKVVWSPHENLDPDDYDLIGLIGVVSRSIREGGTGEILFPQAGARRSAGARSESGQAIARGVEVVITQHKNGLVYVRPWTELSGEQDRELTAQG